MSFSHACFISYRHAGPATPIVNRFCSALSEQLALLTPSLGVYLDDQRLAPGDYLDDELATQLCRSTCMVLLFTPEYFDVNHPYCAREYRAMVDLESRRLPTLPSRYRTKSLIIPVVIRGESRVPSELQPRIFTSFDRLLLQASDVRKSQVVRGIRGLAEAIYERVDAMRYAGPSIHDCSQFRFPSSQEISTWLAAVAPPPLASPTQAHL